MSPWYPTRGCQQAPCKYLLPGSRTHRDQVVRLADATWGYAVDIYLYTGATATLRRYGTAAGNFDAKNIMKLWASLLPKGRVLCADSFFGFHGLAKELAASKRAFLMMTKRSTYGVTWAGEHVQEGQMAVCTVADLKYSSCVCNNLKVGHKPPRVVPMLTNVWCARKGTHHRRSGREVNPSGGGVLHTVARWRWCEPDGPAGEAGWSPDDMGGALSALHAQCND